MCIPYFTKASEIWRRHRHKCIKLTMSATLFFYWTPRVNWFWQAFSRRLIMTKFWRTQIYFFQTAGVKGIFRTLCWSRQTPGFHKTILEFVKRHMFILWSIYDNHRICHFYFTKLHVSYYHFPNSVTLRFIEQARIFTQRFPNRYRLDLQNQ